ncbi:hypothetical protein GW17_00062326, partial [Ensete ventricosum]
RGEEEEKGKRGEQATALLYLSHKELRLWKTGKGERDGGRSREKAEEEGEGRKC